MGKEAVAIRTLCPATSTAQTTNPPAAELPLELPSKLHNSLLPYGQ